MAARPTRRGGQRSPTRVPGRRHDDLVRGGPAARHFYSGRLAGSGHRAGRPRGPRTPRLARARRRVPGVPSDRRRRGARESPPSVARRRRDRGWRRGRARARVSRTGRRHRGAGNRGPGGARDRHRSQEWAALTAEDGPVEIAATTEDSPGFWLCTSGSTGRPKLAMHRHYDLKVTADTYAREILGIEAGDVFFSVGPMFHAYGLGNSLSFPMSVGALTILEAPRPPTPKRGRGDRAGRGPIALLRDPDVLRGAQRVRHPGRHLLVGAARGLGRGAASGGDVAPVLRALRRRDPRRHRLDRDDPHLPVQQTERRAPGNDGSARDGLRRARGRRRRHGPRERRTRASLGAG